MVLRWETFNETCSGWRARKDTVVAALGKALRRQKAACFSAKGWAEGPFDRYASGRGVVQ